MLITQQEYKQLQKNNKLYYDLFLSLKKNWLSILFVPPLMLGDDREYSIDAFKCFMGTELDVLAIGNCF